MAKEYHSEKSPIFDSQKSTKTIRNEAYKVDQLFCNTLYSIVS